MRKVMVFLVVLLFSTACQTASATPTNFEFQKGDSLFPSPTFSDTKTPTISPTPYNPFATKPPPTQIVWPEPYFGGIGPTPVTPVPTPFEIATENDKITFLLIGADRITSGYFRTDTLILAIYFREFQAANLISIPRDLYVYIPGWTMNRINAAYAHGVSSSYPGNGPQLLADTITYNLGIVVDHYAMVDFSGFQYAIDTLDGINVNVLCPYTDWHLIEQDLDPNVEDNWELFTVDSGSIRMDGIESLWYARSRMKSDDFDRGRRQQEILRGIFNRILQVDIVFKLPELYNQINSKVQSSLTFDDLVKLAPYLMNVKPNQIHHYYIDRDQVNGWTTPGGGSVQLPDPIPFWELIEAATNPSTIEAAIEWDYSITVWNSSARQGMEQLAVERLNYLGIEANPEISGFGIISQTLLQVYAEAPDEALILKIKTNFNLSQNQIVFIPDPSAMQEYIFIVGQDFDPCYYPNRAP